MDNKISQIVIQICLAKQEKLLKKERIGHMLFVILGIFIQQVIKGEKIWKKEEKYIQGTEEY